MPQTDGTAEPPPDTSQPAGPPAPPVHALLREDDFDHSACLLELTLLGADYDEPPPVSDPHERDCGVDRPVLLRKPLPGIEIPGGALMRCDMARHLAHWLRDFVRPAAALLPGQPRLTALEPGTTYQCRATVGNDGESLSEHAFGNAFDIAAFRFDGGLRLPVQPRRDNGDQQEAFQRAVRGAACLHFTTVLGPGANAAHDDHLHLDIKARRGGYRLCQ
ncbi:extensin-like domain-containing protein [Paracoccus thiocyanatus]|uniref:extensin-like domain-containing protein n=1 Tax=Paracoccus thiocyanatus TaxID=34006 RepID=UPI002163D96F|nr:extensin family protein [Paracoccus thiocyanatus]